MTEKNRICERQASGLNTAQKLLPFYKWEWKTATGSLTELLKFPKQKAVVLESNTFLSCY